MNCFIMVCYVCNIINIKITINAITAKAIAKFLMNVVRNGDFSINSGFFSHVIFFLTSALFEKQEKNNSKAA